ncbi:MAG: hypothetical protein M1840_004077 [Geoglossum simile]|nr:MAG: hypothetical protein M1840_004077 [Geoglossum simile]
MSLEGQAHFDIVNEKTRDSETGIDGDDAERSGSPASRTSMQSSGPPSLSSKSLFRAYFSRTKWSTSKRHNANTTMYFAAHLATTREEPVLKKVHDKVMYPITPTAAVFGDHGQGSASQAIQVLQTLNRDSPNIGRKRSQNPALLRAAASSGHSAKMAQIFHDAQISLRNDLQLPALAFGKRARKSRLPVLQRQPTERTAICCTKGQNVDQVISTAIRAPETMSLALDTQTKQRISCDGTTTPSKGISSKTYYGAQDDLHSSMSNAGHRRGPNELIDGNFTMEISEVPLHEELVVSKGSTGTRALANEPTPSNPGATNLGFDIWDDEDDSELYFSRRSVALPTPMTSRKLFTPGADRSNVDKWLEDMLSASPRKKWRIPGTPGPESSSQPRYPTLEGRGKAQSARKDRETTQRPPDDEINMLDTDMEPEDSDKENQKPLEGGATNENVEPQQIESLRLRNAATPHKSRIPTLGEKPQTLAVGPPFVAAHHTTPRGSFLETPRRRKQVSRDTAVALPGSEEVAKLSPDVDQYRKGNRPRRERCASYYDRDIINPPEGRDALTESNMSRKLTRAMAFCEEAEDFEFTSMGPRG